MDTSVLANMNGTARKIAVSVLTTLIAGSVVGLLILWQQSVTAEDVSRQIQIESPFVKQEETFRTMKDDVKELRAEQMQQRIILERIDAKLSPE